MDKLWLAGLEGKKAGDSGLYQQSHSTSTSHPPSMIHSKPTDIAEIVAKEPTQAILKLPQTEIEACSLFSKEEGVSSLLILAN